ncbi:S1 RNA-binding domain-containing protein [Halomonas urumqiensis]|uniref:RNA-binding protein n=1 Tax=Halomonas urumqiensis TaxID=1684789 RepID=A0A2N7UK71_9GAMM|nr:S1-like domain-containing RNA-binding protein [Halomonas urumqiensis]PMR80831.1 RNA-binding protein [Halomonas urumqiensis]PTB02788.1 RNA-binding protein [Halomonas urumqiensis]GHE21292.1 GntR family transcriptional regulator [Halomonas urumqiensis]
MADSRDRRPGQTPRPDASSARGAPRQDVSPGARGAPRRYRAPKTAVGDVAYLEVVTVNETGAFLDWGHPRDLLLPYGEQRFRPSVGKRVLVVIYEDQQGRPVASQKLDRFVEDEAAGLAPGDEVTLVIADQTDLGFKAVVNHRFWGLLYRDDITRPLRRGQRVTGYVKRLRQDGRLDISLLPPGEARLDVVGEAVLKALRESGGYLPLGDKSSAAEIKARLGVSKNAYKQAIGRLYKRGVITLEPTGIRLVPGGD